MLACVDASYSALQSTAACVLFDPWQNNQPSAQFVAHVREPKPYVPGHFVVRELPGLLAVVHKAPCLPRVIVVDAYVHLSPEGREGLGAHLYRALDQQVAVIGAAKTWFRGASHARPLTRGQSRRPIWITAAGMDPDDAVQCIASMHGPHRIPTLLKLADTLCRQLAT